MPRSKEPIGVGLIGAGAIGPIHAEAIHDMEEAKLVGVCDKDEARARALAEKFSAGMWCADYHRLLERDDVQMVCVATPPFMNQEITEACARAGKHLIVEKPMAVTLDQADRMVEVSRAAGIKLGVIFPLRFMETSRRIKEMVDEGRLGKLFLGTAATKWYRSREYFDVAGWRKTWAGQGGGALPNQSIHAIDQLIWVMGPVDRVFAYIGTFTHDIEVEDNAVAVLRFKSGAMGIIEGSTSVYPGFPRRLEISGEKGTIVMKAGDIELEAIQGEEIQISGGPDLDYVHKRLGDCSFGPVNMGAGTHEVQIREFIQALREGREPGVNGEEGRKAIEIIAAIYRSAKTGEEIRLPLERSVS